MTTTTTARPRTLALTPLAPAWVIAWASAALLMPDQAEAQAIRCRNAAGQVLYTDQPCPGGEVVVPRRTEEEQRQDARADAQARERAQQAREAALRREQQRLEAERLAQSARAMQPPALAESAACRQARAEAAFLASSFSASLEDQRTARYHAALACGEPPPAEWTLYAAPAWPLHHRAPTRAPHLRPPRTPPVITWPPHAPARPLQAAPAPQPSFQLGRPAYRAVEPRPWR